MPVPSRPFFELSTAAALSRALRRGSSSPATVVPAPVAPPAAAAPAPPATGLPPFERPPVRYAEELWQALLQWVSEALGADGAFALDQRGFAIGSVGGGLEVPPEVLLASFTSVAQLLEAYMGAERTVHRMEVAAEAQPPVSMFTLQWTHETVLIGIVGGRSPAEDELETIRTSITGAPERFAAGNREIAS